MQLRPPPSIAGQKADFGITLRLLGTSNERLWMSPNDGSDLAVIHVPDEITRYGKINAISINDFGTDEDIYQGASIIVLGYPSLIGEDFLMSPYARGGIVSWTDITDGTNKPFLVDSNLYPGNSGGPVFHNRSGMARTGNGVQLGGGIKLIGIVSKGAVQEAPVMSAGVPIQTRDPFGNVNPAQAMVLGVGGIGLIEPISKARGLLFDCLKY